MSRLTPRDAPFGTEPPAPPPIQALAMTEPSAASYLGLRTATENGDVATRKTIHQTRGVVAAITAAPPSRARGDHGRRVVETTTAETSERTAGRRSASERSASAAE